MWAVVPFDAGVVLADINVGLLYVLAASSLGVYGIIIAGWASNSKYPFYSALRAAAQMVSYEVAIGFIGRGSPEHVLKDQLTQRLRVVERE